jgi:UDP-perosamine 4-acetyltransferase
MIISVGLDPDLLPLMLKNGCRDYIAIEANPKYPQLNYLGDDGQIPTQMAFGAVFFFGFDNPKLRRKLFAMNNFHGVSLISGTSVCEPNISAISGITIADLTFVGSGVQIQNFVKVGVRTSIHHDSKVGAFSVIGPSVTICGRVSVGEEVFIGAGATILPRLKIGDGAVIGAGAVVTKDVPPNACVVGVPARLV